MVSLELLECSLYHRSKIKILLELTLSSLLINSWKLFNHLEKFLYIYASKCSTNFYTNLLSIFYLHVYIKGKKHQISIKCNLILHPTSFVSNDQRELLTISDFNMFINFCPNALSLPFGRANCLLVSECRKFNCNFSRSQPGICDH